MSRIEKFINIFTPKLSESEIAERIGFAEAVTQELIADPRWTDWITAVYIFGSTVKGTARKMSDIDLVIRTKQDYFFGADFSFITHGLITSIEIAKEKLGIPARIKINPQILAEKWLTTNPNKYKEIMDTAMKIYEKP